MPLRFPIQEIPYFAGRYHYEQEPALEALVPVVQRQGYLSREQLHTICEWKSPRRADRNGHRCEHRRRHPASSVYQGA